MKNVMLWAGAGQIGKAIARRIGTGMKIVVGDKKIENAQAMAKTMNEAGFDVAPVEMDLSSRESHCRETEVRSHPNAGECRRRVPQPGPY